MIPGDNQACVDIGNSRRREGSRKRGEVMGVCRKGKLKIVGAREMRCLPKFLQILTERWYEITLKRDGVTSNWYAEFSSGKISGDWTDPVNWPY